MARWMVNRNDSHTAVDGLAELRELARKGRLGAADMVQPPGAAGWLYASEIPELKDALTEGARFVDEPIGGYAHDAPKGSWGNVAAGLVLVVAFLALGFYIYGMIGKIPDGQRKLLGEGGLRFSELVVSSPAAKLLTEPQANAGTAVELKKDTVLELLAKRGDFYKARMKTGGEQGWVREDLVIPVYLLGGGDVKKDLDPLYNPDQYIEVQNASWMQLPEDRKNHVTVFQFLLENTSTYDMTDLVLVARLKDSKGHEIRQVEFKVEGVVPAEDATMVGTIVDPKTKEKRLITAASFHAMAEGTPDLRLEYNEGVEVKMEEEDFNEANITVIELRAIPKEKS